MGLIFIPNHIILQRQQCVHIHSRITHFNTGNVYFDVVPNFHVLIFLAKKHMINILALVLQFYFTFIV